MDVSALPRPSTSQTPGDVVDPSSIAEQLTRILSSRTFQKAERLSDFLRFIVGETLAGRGDSLKEYTVAVEVFGRAESFDPRTDSVVRVAARSLRSKLKEYYDNEGARDAVVIQLPKGRYEPTFSAATRPPDADSSAVPPARGSRRRAVRWAALALFALTVVGAVIYVAMTTRRPREVVVAVLPFEPGSQAEEAQVFAEGLNDELTTRLAGIEGFRVIARTSAKLFHDAADPVTEARKYGVDALVEGRIARTDDAVRVSVRLVDASKGYQLWGESYDRDGRDSFLVQDEIATSIARSLPPKMGLPIATSTKTAGKPEAVRLYWTGRYVRRQARADSMPRSAALFEQATAVDPGYADAWAALADTQAMMGYHGIAGRTVQECVTRARAAARRALDLDPASTEARVALAQVAFFFDRSPRDAERLFREALKLNPSYYKTRQRYSFLLASQGRFDEAVAQSRAAIRLDPLSMGITNDFAVILYVAKRYDEALAAAREALRGDPGFSPAHALIGCCYSAQGRHREAIAEFQQAIQMSERFSYLVGHLGHNMALAGNRQEAFALLKELTDTADQSSISYVHVAYILSGLREYDRAISALEKAVARYDADVIYMGLDPALDELRGQRRFLQLLDHVGLRNLRSPR